MVQNYPLIKNETGNIYQSFAEIALSFFFYTINFPNKNLPRIKQFFF